MNTIHSSDQHGACDIRQAQSDKAELLPLTGPEPQRFAVAPGQLLNVRKPSQTRTSYNWGSLWLKHRDNIHTESQAPSLGICPTGFKLDPED